MKENQATHWGAGEIIFVLSVPVFVALILSLTFCEHNKTKSRIQACLAKNQPTQVVTGVLRLAGDAFYVHDDQWRFITTNCSGKTARSCREANPGIVALENNLGHQVSVEFCDRDAVAYSVAGNKHSNR